ncbi:MAG: YeeE/YedE family protein [Methylotenera sp.]
MMENFTPWSSLAGGILIGLAASIMILMNGRIAGISGIVGSISSAHRADVPWRIAFLVGLIVSPFIYGVLGEMPVLNFDASNLQIVIAGLLVGLGSRYGSGCTSGHGVCGIARLSVRSMVATVVFIGAGIVTVYVTRHLI